MISHDYKEMSSELLERAKGAWSIENMAAHEAEGRSVEYVGSYRRGNIISDYYQDSAGAWWYKNRGIIDGHIVSMDVYIFGKEAKKERLKKWNKN